MDKNNSNKSKLLFVGLSLLITAGVFYLGIWQTSRHFEKKFIIEHYKDQVQKPIQNITDTALNDPIINKFQIYKAKATFIPDSIIFLGPKQIAKVVGYNIVSLFEIENKQKMIINLGFIPLDEKDSFTINPGLQSLTLMQRQFRPRPNIFIPKNQPNSQSWFYLDQPSLVQHYNTQIAGVYFDLLSDNFASEIKPFNKNEVNFFNEHSKYAITWFSLAAILAILVVVYIRAEKVRFRS